MNMHNKMDEMKQDGTTAKAKANAKLEQMKGTIKKKEDRLSEK